MAIPSSFNRPQSHRPYYKSQEPLTDADNLEPLFTRPNVDTENPPIHQLQPPPKLIYDDTIDFGTTTSTHSYQSHHSGSNTTSTAISPPSRFGAYHSPQSSFSVASVQQASFEYINNSTLVYVPITLPCGSQVMAAPDVLSNCPMVLRSVEADLRQIYHLLPWSVHALVRRTKIWVNASYSYGTKDDPVVLRHSTAHHGEGWLVDCAHDRPDKALGIEIYSCFDFERMRLHWNGCGLLLHEFCHLIHQQCLGLDNPKIQNLYHQACASRKYERTLRRDWAGKPEETDLAYAMVDFKEFFAEMSVTYLSRGYRDLDEADAHFLEHCSPPLLEPLTLQRILGAYGVRTCEEAYTTNNEDEDDCDFVMSSLFSKHRNWSLKGKKPKIRMAHPVWQEAMVARNCRDAAHCNKFYPFTHGQLRKHDPQLFEAMRKLWQEISCFDDPLVEEEDKTFCWSLRKFLPRIG